MFFFLSLQENHGIETNFKDKKQLVVIVIRLETILETKNIFGF